MSQKYISARPDGWFLLAWLCLAVLQGSIAVAAFSPDPVAGARMVIRLTARTSLVLFAVAFAASSLAQLLPSPGSMWLRAHRKFFGLAFAFSHLVHAVGIIALWRLDPLLFAALTTPASFIAGGIGYAIIIAMVATSFDRPARLLGPRAWSALHMWGAWLLALFFVVNFGRRAVVDPAMYWPYLALIGCVMILRLVAGRRAGSRA